MSMTNTLAEIISAKNKETHTLNQNKSVFEAIENMSSRNIGALVILDDDENLVGIFSERDLLKRVAAQELDAKTTKISEVMTPEPICVDTSMTVQEAMHKVTEKQIRHLPLISGGKLRALISNRDLTAWVANAQKTEIDGLSQKLISVAAKDKALVIFFTVFVVLVVISVLTY